LDNAVEQPLLALLKSATAGGIEQGTTSSMLRWISERLTSPLTRNKSATAMPEAQVINNAAPGFNKDKSATAMPEAQVINNAAPGFNNNRVSTYFDATVLNTTERCSSNELHMDQWIEFVGAEGCVESNCTHLKVTGLSETYVFPNASAGGFPWQLTWAGEHLTSESEDSKVSLCRILGSKGVVTIPEVALGQNVLDVQITYIKLSVCKQRNPDFRYQSNGSVATHVCGDGSIPPNSTAVAPNSTAEESAGSAGGNRAGNDEFYASLDLGETDQPPDKHDRSDTVVVTLGATDTLDDAQSGKELPLDKIVGSMIKDGDGIETKKDVQNVLKNQKRIFQEKNVLVRAAQQATSSRSLQTTNQTRCRRLCSEAVSCQSGDTCAKDSDAGLRELEDEQIKAPSCCAVRKVVLGCSLTYENGTVTGCTTSTAALFSHLV